MALCVSCKLEKDTTRLISVSCFLFVLPKPFNSHEWPSQNFSLQYQYNIKQTSDKKKEKYKLGDY